MKTTLKISKSRPGVVVMWSKIFDHDHGQSFKKNRGQMAEILTSPWQITKFSMVKKKFDHKI